MAFLLSSIALLVLWAGFILHTSAGSDLLVGKYSSTYAIFLLVLSMVETALISWAWQRRATLAKTLRDIGLITCATVLVAAIILPSAYIYLHARALRQDVFKPLAPNAHAFFQIEEAPDPPSRLDSGLRVLALGGSTTYGSRLGRDEAFPAVLENLLRERFPSKRIRVLNGGVPWHTSMHSLLRYTGRYSDWQPHVVIIMHAFNDIFQSSEGRLTTGKFRPDYGHFFGALGMRVNSEDRLAASVKGIWSGNWLARTWYSDLRDMPVEPRRPSVDLLRALPSFQRNLRELSRRVRDDNAKVVLMTQPYLYREGMPSNEKRALFYSYYYKDYARVPSIEEQRTAMDAFNEATRQIAKTTGASLVDLERALPKSADVMYDDVHYTRRGARQVAVAISERLDWSSLLHSRPRDRSTATHRANVPPRR